VRSHLIRAADGRAALARIDAEGDSDEATALAELIVESVTEDFETKVGVLRHAGKLNAFATLATNTSALSISALGDATGLSHRLLGTHYWNPPSLMPLVELIAGKGTDPTRVTATEGVLRALGKEPVVAPDIPGFIWNRLQFALIREAAWLVATGAATADTIDLIAQRGLGRRWSIIGPFASLAAGGAATVASVADIVFPTLRNDPLDLRQVDVDAIADVADRIERRDRRLAQMLIADRRERTEASR
jgi:3-hydroxybutyryl-CoA dehydrogenase